MMARRSMWYALAGLSSRLQLALPDCSGSAFRHPTVMIGHLARPLVPWVYLALSQITLGETPIETAKGTLDCSSKHYIEPSSNRLRSPKPN